MYFVVNLKNGHIDFKSNNNVGYGYDIDNVVFFRQITENEYFRFTKN